MSRGKISVGWRTLRESFKRFVTCPKLTFSLQISFICTCAFLSYHLSAGFFSCNMD